MIEAIVGINNQNTKNYMEISELNRILRNKAIKYGLCDDWQNNIWNRDLSQDELLEIFIKGFDFSVKNDWLDYDFCKDVFTKEKLNAHNIYIDQEISLEYVDSGTYIFLGKSRANVSVVGFKAVTIHCRHDSDVNVTAFDGARVFVTYYDSSNGECSKDRWSSIRKYDRR